MSTLVFLLEEPSAREMLKGVVPRLIGQGIDVRYVPFEGKQDLRRQLRRKLQGWRAPYTRFVLLQDQDAADCHDVKQALMRECAAAGRPDVLVRIACHELESFYLGDLTAVEAGLALPRLSREQETRRFREPDRLGNAAEELAKLTRGTYQKLSGSRAIGPHLQLGGDNRSRSFNVLMDGIRRIGGELAAIPQN